MSGNLAQLLKGHRRNAILSWLLVGLIAVAVLGSLTREDYLWAGFALVVLALTVLPAVVRRNATAMLPWEVTTLAALPVLGRSFEWVLAGGLLETYLFDAGDLAAYFSVAAMALLLAVELHLFTEVEMSDSFALGFVVITTLATAGVWAVLRWSLDRVFETTFILDPTLTEDAIEHALMLEFVASAAAGVVAGLVFALYVRRVIEPTDRLPTEVTV